MPILIFHCPECNKAIPAEVDLVDNPKESTKTIRLVCARSGKDGCGWIGYVPVSWGNRF